MAIDSLQRPQFQSLQAKGGVNGPNKQQAAKQTDNPFAQSPVQNNKPNGLQFQGSLGPSTYNAVPQLGAAQAQKPISIQNSLNGLA